MDPQIEALIGGLVLPDALHWDEETQNLYFVDTNDKSIYIYTPETKVYAKAALGLNNVTVIIPVQAQKDKFLITHTNNLSTIVWDGKGGKASNLQRVASLEGAENGFYIWCDGKADPRGKFWAVPILMEVGGADDGGGGDDEENNEGDANNGEAGDADEDNEEEEDEGNGSESDSWTDVSGDSDESFGVDSSGLSEIEDLLFPY